VLSSSEWRDSMTFSLMHLFIISPYDGMGGYLVYCFFFVCRFVCFVRLRISQLRKKLGA